MEIKKIPRKRINPAPYNPRRNLKPGDPEYESLKRSIKEFGYIDPLVWNKRTGHLVGGHQRLKVLDEMGVEGVEVSVVDLSLTKEKALNLALNRISGDWDEVKLQEILSELYDSDIDIELTGFEETELKELTASLNPPEINLDNFQEVEYDNKENYFKLILFLNQEQARRLKENKPKEKPWEDYILSLLPEK